MSVRVREYTGSHEFRKVARYVTVSGISTVISLVMLYIFYRQVGLSVRWANVTATVIATVPSYYLNRTWAWKRSGKSHFRREVVPFWVIAAISLALSTLAVQFAEHESLKISSSHQIQTLLVLFANFFTYGVMWAGKFFLFNKVLFVHHGSDEADPLVLVPVTAEDGTDGDPSVIEVGSSSAE
jgi:putative flippase GtrA